MTETALYFLKIIEEDQANKRKGYRGAFDDPAPEAETEADDGRPAAVDKATN